MRKDMEKFHASNNQNYRWKNVLANLGFTIIIFMLFTGSMMGQKSNDANVEDVVKTFLETWLIKGDVDVALTFISEKPVFPSCWVDKGESLEWRKKRSDVIEKVNPVFTKLAEEPPKTNNLEAEIESQKKKIEYPPLNKKYEKLFDIYLVDDSLRKSILMGVCGDRKNDTSKFFVQGVKKQKELYLVLFHFKQGLLVTMVWTKEKKIFRLLYLEFPLE